MARQKKTTGEELSELEKRFIDIYLINGNVGSTAYLSAKPGCLMSSAEVESCKTLKKTKVINEIEYRREQIRLKEDIQLSFLVDELKDIIYSSKADEKTDRSSILKALDQLAKLGGLYTKNIKTDITTNGNSLDLININIVRKKDNE